MLNSFFFERALQCAFGQQPFQNLDVHRGIVKPERSRSPFFVDRVAGIEVGLEDFKVCVVCVIGSGTAKKWMQLTQHPVRKWNDFHPNKYSLLAA